MNIHPSDHIRLIKDTDDARRTELASIDMEEERLFDELKNALEQEKIRKIKENIDTF